MAESKKRDSSSVSSKEKNSLLDLDIGKDFLSSWKSISIAEGDGMDFDLTPGNKKSFNFDKASGYLPPLKKMIKPRRSRKNHPVESLKEKRTVLPLDLILMSEHAKADSPSKLENFNFEPSFANKEGSKAQKDKSKKESSPNGSECQDKEGSINMNLIGSMTTSEDRPPKPSLSENLITFDMDSLVGGSADLEPTKKNCPSDLAMDDAVSSERSAAIHEVASDKAKSHSETTIAPRELPKISQCEKLVSAKPVDREANDAVQDLSTDALSNNEPTGGNSPEADNVDSRNTNATGSNGEQDVNVESVVSSTCYDEHATSENSHLIQTVEISETNNAEESQVGVEDHVINNRERTELGQVKSLAEDSCTTSSVSGILCDTPSGRENQKLASEILMLPLVSQPADLLEKETEKGREPLVTCSKYFIQSDKPGCPVPEASTQTTLSSLSSKKMGFTQPSQVEGRRDGDSVQSDKKLVSLPLQHSKTLLRELPHIRRQESCTGLKISSKDKADTKSSQKKGETSMKDLDTLRSSCAAFPLEVNKNAAQNSGNSTTLASIPITKTVPADEHKLSSIERVRKAPDLPGLKLPCLNFDSTKSPIQKEIKSVGNIGQNRVLLTKTQSDIAHFPKSQKQTPSTISMKRKTLEEDAANIIALYPSKRLVQSPTASRKFVETSEKVLDKKVPKHSNVENDCIKNTIGNRQVSTFHIPHEVKIKEVGMSFSIESDNIIKQAEAYSKELDDVRIIVFSYLTGFEVVSICAVFRSNMYNLPATNLCNMLKKKHDEAKQVLVQAIVNNNKLLMLNNPLLDQKISLNLSTLIVFTGKPGSSISINDTRKLSLLSKLGLPRI
ncbi:hypothetical protein DH2020_034311 [Rehmannia glutinosa]|uniref:Uncharacterized protein n=1 Tax=Rehmannia glutinosa TaxID=99300 RepID=A0ABR0VC94_REHGL